MQRIADRLNIDNNTKKRRLADQEVVSIDSWNKTTVNEEICLIPSI